MKDTQSFRRKKLIEDMAPQRRAEQLASNQSAELQNISAEIADSQTASELIAETVENKSNQIIQSIDKVGKGLDNVVAGTELTAEASEKTTKAVGALQDVTTAMSEKLSKLSTMLSEKLVTVTTAPSTSHDSQTLLALKEAMPIEVEQPKLTELLEKLVPQHPVPEDAPFLPPVPVPDSGDDEKKKKKEKDNDSNAFDQLFKTTKAGFKATVSVGDRIASMLFRYTVTAVAEAAKIAGIMFALVLGIDSIRVYFQYFMKKFDESWAKFDEQFKEWGPLISDLMIMAKNVSSMFTEKNWLGLGKAIAQGIMDFTTGMADLILVGMAKLTAAVLRGVGMDDKADALEGSVLQGYQDRTGASLDAKDQLTLAKYQDKQDQEKTAAKKESFDRFKDSTPEALSNAVKYGSVSKETAEEISKGKMDFEFQNKPEAERLEAFKKRNEAQAAIIRTNERTKKIMSPTSSDLKNANDAKADIETRLADPALQNVPQRLNTPKLLEDLNGNLKAFNERVPVTKPTPAASKEDTQTVARIDTAQKAKETTVNNSNPTTLTQTNIMQKTSKTQYNIPPQSATNAPGMHRSLSV